MVLPANKPYPPILPGHKASPLFGWYSFYHPMEGRRLSQPRWLVTYQNKVPTPKFVCFVYIPVTARTCTPFDQAHSTSTIRPLILRHLGGNLSTALIACSTTRSRSSAARSYVLARILFTSFVYTVQCSIVLLLDM